MYVCMYVCRLHYRALCISRATQASEQSQRGRCRRSYPPNDRNVHNGNHNSNRHNDGDHGVTFARMLLALDMYMVASAVKGNDDNDDGGIDACIFDTDCVVA